MKLEKVLRMGDVELRAGVATLLQYRYQIIHRDEPIPKCQKEIHRNGFRFEADKIELNAL